MKVSVEVDATPEELRRFFGLPDVQPLHEDMLRRLREGVASGEDGLDPASLMLQSLPAHLRNVEALQRVLWDAMSNAAPGGGASGDEGSGKGAGKGSKRR